MPRGERRILTNFDASTAGFDRGARRMDRNLGRFQRRTETRLDKMDRRFREFGANLGITLPIIATTAAMAALAKAIADVVRNGDKLKKLEGRFKALTGSAERAGVLIKGAFDITTETGASFEGVSSGLSRFTIAAEAIGATDEEVIQLTQNLTKLGTIGGAGAQEVRSGIIQLGQSLAKGRLDGDELRSVMENLPLVAKAIADGFGVGIGEIKKMGEEGKLLSGQVFQAILDKTQEIDAQFEQLPVTVERAAGQMASAWIRVTAEIDKSIDASGTFAAIIVRISEHANDLAQALERANDPGLIESARILQLQGAISNLDDQIEKFKRDGTIDTVIGQNAVNDVASLRDELEGLLEVAQDVARAEADVRNVGTSGGPRTRATVGGAGGLGRVDTSPIPKERGKFVDDPFSTGTRVRRARSTPREVVDESAVRILESLRERIELLRLEQQLIGQTASEQSRLNAEFQREKTLRELLLAQQKEGSSITEAEIAEANAAADAVRDLTIAIDDETRARREQKEAAERAAQAVKTVGDAITNAITQAKSFEEALINVAVALANIALQELTRPQSGGASILGDVLGSILGAAVGGASGGSSNPLQGSIKKSAKGNVFKGGNVIPFRTGGIIRQPTIFPMANGGIGLAGEAGEEAILPLSKTRGGNLGVEAVVPQNIGRAAAQSITIGDTIVSITEPGITEPELERILADHRRQTVEDIVQLNERYPHVLHT